MSMKSALGMVMILSLAAVACSNNECEDAKEKIEDECKINLGDNNPSDEEVAECNSRDECTAKCINAASCTEIKDVLAFMSNSFSTCLSKCNN